MKNDDQKMPSGKLLTVNQFVKAYPAFTLGGIRQLIFYKGGEAEKAGAIVKFGRKILVDDERFISWVKAGGTRVICGGAGK